VKGSLARRVGEGVAPNRRRRGFAESRDFVNGSPSKCGACR
jgi:hypothetical protein